MRGSLTTILCFLMISLSAQNICSDGIDNDSDGLEDSADFDCDHGFHFQAATCTAQGPPSLVIDDVVIKDIGQNESDTQSKLIVGDIDGDRIPEFIVTSKWDSEVKVMASRDHIVNDKPYKLGDVKSKFNATSNASLFNLGFAETDACYPDNLLFESEVVIADIDIDGNAEIFCIVSNRKGEPKTPPTCYYLIGFEYAVGNLQVLPGYPKKLGSDSPGIPGITDFDGDGKAELYLKNRIYAAENGALLADGGGNWDTEINSAPVAIDMLGNAQQELVCGNIIYAVPNLSTRTFQSLTVAADMNLIPGLPAAKKYFPKVYHDEVEYGTSNFSSVAVVDLENDDFLDVIISGATNGVSGNTAVFYWNVNKQTVSIFTPPDPIHAMGWPWGTSRLNVADVDGDGNLNLNFTAGSQLFSLKLDNTSNTLLSTWTAPRLINGSRTGLISCTAFDFNGDGGFEIIYRDAQELVVLNGLTGTNKLWSSTCQSHSFNETPIVADANADGKTDICVPCYSYQTGFNDNDGLNKQALGTIKLAYANDNPWLPARGVWNQPGYFAANINDNLSVPRTQININTKFSNGTCTAGALKTLNTFLNQLYFLNQHGCPEVSAHNLRFELALSSWKRIVEAVGICGGNDVQVRLGIKNIGDTFFLNELLLSFYDGDPNQPGSTAKLLHQTSTHPIMIEQSDDIQYPSTPDTYISFNAPNDAFDLYVVVNKSSEGEWVYQECDFEDNTSKMPIPGVLGANQVDQDRFTISWPSLSGIDNYLLDVSEHADFSTLLPGYDKKVLPSTINSQEVTGLNSGTIYYYRLFTDANQQVQQVCTDKQQITIPATPTILPVTTTTANGFTAKWNTVKGADFYEVDVSLQSDNFSVLFPVIVVR